jgi:hypothetical protein
MLHVNCPIFQADSPPLTTLDPTQTYETQFF